jgi:[ribosomal protein S5]-alanine N-acetyltransferase
MTDQTRKLPGATTLKTARLILRPLCLEDASQTQSLFARWEIVKYLNAKIPWPFPANGAHRYYRDLALPAMERCEEWHWTLRQNDVPERIIGAIGLVREGDVNRGFWLAEPWQGRGLMTEAVVAANDFWFDVLGLPALRTQKAVANVRSRALSAKTGMRLVETAEREFVSGALPAEIWEITAAEWRKWKSVTSRRES